MYILSREYEDLGGYCEEPIAVSKSIELLTEKYNEVNNYEVTHLLYEPLIICDDSKRKKLEEKSDSFYSISEILYLK